MTKPKRKSPRKDPNIYPPGWNYGRAKAIADYYDSRKSEDMLHEIETARSVANLVWMEIPQDLVPKVRKLLARSKKPA